MNNSKLLVGFLTGAAVGGLLGILLAPDKGSETRRKILEKGSDYGDAMKEAGESLKDTINGAVDGVKDRFSRARGKAESAI